MKWIPTTETLPDATYPVQAPGCSPALLSEEVLVVFRGKVALGTRVVYPEGEFDVGLSKPIPKGPPCWNWFVEGLGPNRTVDGEYCEFAVEDQSEVTYWMPIPPVPTAER